MHSDSLSTNRHVCVRTTESSEVSISVSDIVVKVVTAIATQHTRSELKVDTIDYYRASVRPTQRIRGYHRACQSI